MECGRTFVNTPRISEQTLRQQLEFPITIKEYVAHFPGREEHPPDRIWVEILYEVSFLHGPACGATKKL